MQNYANMGAAPFFLTKGAALGIGSTNALFNIAVGGAARPCAHHYRRRPNKTERNIESAISTQRYTTIDQKRKAEFWGLFSVFPISRSLTKTSSVRNHNISPDIPLGVRTIYDTTRPAISVRGAPGVLPF